MKKKIDGKRTQVTWTVDHRTNDAGFFVSVVFPDGEESGAFEFMRVSVICVQDDALREEYIAFANAAADFVIRRFLDSIGAIVESSEVHRHQ